MSRWFSETLHDDFRLELKSSKTIYLTQTKYQKLAIFENDTFGRVMMLDDIFQTSEADEFIYHEMLTHIPIIAHGSVQKVLIIGGGDGGALKEVLKHKSVKKVTMVEIDEGVVEASKEYLSMICGNAFNDPRTELIIDDGVKFVTNSRRKYDLIIVDSTDPVGPGEVLFTAKFYEACQKRLTSSGILITQNGMPFLQAGELFNSMNDMKDLFIDVSCYLATIPTYSGGVMAFGWASNSRIGRTNSLMVLKQRFDRAEIATSYYTPEVHQASFALPPYIKNLADA